MRAMIGTYSPNACSLTMTATNLGGGNAGQMVMKMKLDAKRTGECDGSEKIQVGN